MIASTPSEQKTHGAYYTPRAIADFLVQWSVRTPADRVLDPSCGEGVFLAAALDRLKTLGATSTLGSVLGMELEGEVALSTQRTLQAASISTGDFFFQDPSRQFFDAVVGNPPYIRYHYFRGPTRQRAIDMAKAAGVNLSGLASSWAAFVVHASRFLKTTGRLAVVLPAELLTTDYAGPVREFLRRRFASVHVITFEQRVFPGALVDVVLVLAEGEGPGQVHVHRLQQAADLLLFELSKNEVIEAPRWTEGLLTKNASFALELASTFMDPLGMHASVDIGIVTGANDFFLLSEDDRIRLRLPYSDVTPIVARSQHLHGLELRTTDWKKLLEANRPVWLFTPSEASGHAADYIKYGDLRAFNLAYKCRIRSPWWRLKGPRTPDLLMSYMSNEVVRLVVNSAGVSTTNLIHNVRMQHPARLNPMLLALSWHNSATMLSVELSGRAYGGGVLKLETKEAERVLIPRLTEDVCTELTQLAPQIDQLLMQRNYVGIADLIDPLVLADMNSKLQNFLRDAWRDMVQRRKRRGKG